MGGEKQENPVWRNWVNQVPVFGFNSGRYDINMIKEYFVGDLAEISDVNVAKKENSNMFLSTPKFKFRKKENHIVTYKQTKLGLSAYYDKRVVHEDGIHTSCLTA